MKIKDLLDAHIMDACDVIVFTTSQRSDDGPLFKGMLDEIPYYLTKFPIVPIGEDDNDDGMEIVFLGSDNHLPYLRILVDDNK